ncbi:MAG: hypothetical protein V4805_04950 [Pseudomonadota bacterium]
MAEEFDFKKQGGIGKNTPLSARIYWMFLNTRVSIFDAKDRLNTGYSIRRAVLLPTDRNQ